MNHREHWIAFGDCTIAIRERGPSASSRSRGTLVFIHGRLGTADFFEPLIQRLRLHYRCLAIDLPGCGRSHHLGDRPIALGELAEIVHQLVLHLAPEGVFYVGHDVGGAIAQLCAWGQAPAPHGLLLINSASVLRPLSPFSIGPFAWWGRWSLARRIHLSEGPSEAEFYTLLMRAWRRREERRPILALIRDLEASWPDPFEREEWLECCRQSRVPTLVLWGEREWLNRREDSTELARLVGEGYFSSRIEAGHWLCQDDPEWLDRKIREFLFQIDPISRLPRSAFL